jgi:hypothetical protein
VYSTKQGKLYQLLSSHGLRQQLLLLPLTVVLGCDLQACASSYLISTDDSLMVVTYFQAMLGYQNAKTAHR